MAWVVKGNLKGPKGDTGDAGVSPITSVFGRVGAVIALAGDYTVGQVTGAVPSTLTLTAGNGLTGGGTLADNRSFALGTPGTITNATTNSVTATSHTHALTLSASDLTSILGYSVVQQGTGVGQSSNAVKIGWNGSKLLATVDSANQGAFVFEGRTITAGDGLTGGGTLADNRTITLGTPGTLSGSTTNAVQATSHTHALSANLSAWDGITPSSKADAANYLIDGSAGTLGGTYFYTSGGNANIRFVRSGGGYSYMASSSTGDLMWSGSTVYTTANLNLSSKQDALGFTPVEQGGGPGQATNKIRIGWGGVAAGLKVSVDSTDLGTVIFGNLTQGDDVLSIPQRTAAGDLIARLHRSTYPDSGTISGAIAYRVDATSDNYIRFCSSPAAVRSWLGLGTAAVENHSAAGTPLTIAQRDSLGELTTDTHFKSSDTEVVLSTNGAGTVYLRPNGKSSTSGQLTLNSGGVATAYNFATTSDVRKKNILGTHAARRTLTDNLQLFHFSWKDTGNRDISVIAQHVQQVAPEYVREGTDGMLSVDKAALALECILSLAERVRILESRLGDRIK